MPVRFDCTTCGVKLKAREEQRGASMRCPACAAGVQVPGPDELEVDERPTTTTTTPSSRQWARIWGWPVLAALAVGLAQGWILGIFTAPAYYDSRYKSRADAATGKLSAVLDTWGEDRYKLNALAESIRSAETPAALRGVYEEIVRSTRWSPEQKGPWDYR